MKKEIKRILIIGDGVVPTGFSTVLHNIISNLNKKVYEIHHLAVNYYGDPHDKEWKVYPAVLGGDIWGFGRLDSILNSEPEGIFILNDVWVIDQYLKIIKDHYKEKPIPPIMVYFPVDAKVLDKDWFRHFDIVTKVAVYTQFGQKEVKLASDIDATIIPHGINRKDFYKIDLPKREIKAKIYPDKEDFLDSFIVLNANRNQPRKRVDLTLLGFRLFCEGKPENVKLYMHMGVKDMGWDLFKLAHRYGIDSRLIVTNTNPNIQVITLDKLNLIYNGTDVGVNTAVGEGWSLTNMEHAVSGAPQIVPDHSALHEIYSDCGMLVPVSTWAPSQDVLTVHGVVRVEDVATALENIYQDKELYNELSRKTLEKFSDEKYSWDYIVKNMWTPLFREVYG
jgi:glycosyltransferase involved in cell wall biosynthesis